MGGLELRSRNLLEDRGSDDATYIHDVTYRTEYTLHSHFTFHRLASNAKRSNGSLRIGIGGQWEDCLILEIAKEQTLFAPLEPTHDNG